MTILLSSPPQVLEEGTYKTVLMVMPVVVPVVVLYSIRRILRLLSIGTNHHELFKTVGGREQAVCEY
jgi:hypothetical protein